MVTKGQVPLSPATKLISKESLIPFLSKEDVYDASGRKLPALQKGINIIRMSDGTVRKIFIK